MICDICDQESEEKVRIQYVKYLALSQTFETLLVRVKRSPVTPVNGHPEMEQRFGKAVVKYLQESFYRRPTLSRGTNFLMAVLQTPERFTQWEGRTRTHGTRK